MRGKTVFLAGLAVGYVLGTKAGRERYEQIVRATRRVGSNPSVQEAAGLVQAQSVRLMTTGRALMRERMGDRWSDGRFGHSRFGQRLLGEGGSVMPDDRPSPSRQGF